MSSAAVPDARVSFDAHYHQRVRRLAEEFAARRARALEVFGAGRRAGGGDEFVGHRPLRVGEDARDLDWELYARLERPFVRERRAEAGERWAIVLDGSRSMAVGAPSKLQRAAELAGALAACGLRCGARVELLRHSSAARGFESLDVARTSDLPRALGWIESARATSNARVVTLCAQPSLAAARRVFVLGDLFDVQPDELLALARRGRFVSALAILAEIELHPPRAGAVRWIDPESGAELSLELETRLVERFRAALERRLELWTRAFVRRGQSFLVAPVEREFEELVRALL